MLYQPRLTFSLYSALLDGFINAGAVLVADLIAEQNKEWQYYAGLAVGYTVAATGVPNATAAVYFTGEALNVTLFHSPEGGFVDVLLDGVLFATIDTYAASGNWQAVGLGAAAGLFGSTLEFVNRADTSQGQSYGSWFGIGAIEVNGQAEKVNKTMTSIISFQLQDEDGRSRSFPVYFDETGLTLAQINAAATDMAEKLDAVTGAVITGISASLNVPVPGTAKSTAVAGVDLPDGMLLSYNVPTEGYAESYFVPGWRETMSVNKAPLWSDAAVRAFLSLFDLGADDGAGGNVPITSKRSGALSTTGADEYRPRAARETFRK